MTRKQASLVHVGDLITVEHIQYTVLATAIVYDTFLFTVKATKSDGNIVVPHRVARDHKVM